MSTHKIHVRNIKLGDHIVHLGQLHRVYGFGTFPSGKARVLMELVEDNSVTADVLLHRDDTVNITIFDD